MDDGESIDLGSAIEAEKLDHLATTAYLKAIVCTVLHELDRERIDDFRFVRQLPQISQLTSDRHFTAIDLNRQLGTPYLCRFPRVLYIFILKKEIKNNQE